MQSQTGLGLKNGVVDEQTMLAMKDSVEKRTWVIVNGKKALVTAEQLAELRKRAIAAAVSRVQPFVSLANEAYTYYTAHNTLRQNNVFLATFVEWGAKATMPDLGLFKAAQGAAAAMVNEASSGTLTPASMKAWSQVISKAAYAMEDYRKSLYGGGADFISQLELIRDGAILALQVLAAIATAGGSLQVQVGVMAAVGMYEQTLKEVDKLAKDTKYDVGQGQKNILAAGAVEAAIQLMFMGADGKAVMKKIADKAAESFDSALGKYAVQVADGGLQDMLKEALKLTKDFCDPKKELTPEVLATKLGTAFAVGAGLKHLEPLVKSAGRRGGAGILTKQDLTSFGKQYDLDKSGEELVKQVAEAVTKPTVEDTLKGWTYNSDHPKFEKAVHDKVVKHPDVIKAAKDAGKKGKKK